MRTRWVAVLATALLGGCSSGEAPPRGPSSSHEPPRSAPAGPSGGSVAVLPETSCAQPDGGAAPIASAEAPPPASSVAPGPCPADMVDVGLTCMDRYEAPNEEGKPPLLMQSALDGQAWCEERGKRLCNESEWKRACMGKRGYDFPYGPKWKRGVCNDDETWKPPRWSAIRSHPSEAAKKEAARLDQSEPAGANPDCVSPDGVFDMPGNAAEWVVRTEDNDTMYDHVLMGCYWARCYRPPHTPSCNYVNWMHRGAERSYETGFRCCKDKAR